MKKKVYQKPLLVSEEFVAQQYVAACTPTSEWRPKGDAIAIANNMHLYKDLNNNKQLDQNEAKDNNKVTADSSGSAPNVTPFYAFDVNPPHKMYLVYPTKANSVVGYELDEIINKNNS